MQLRTAAIFDAADPAMRVSHQQPRPPLLLLLLLPPLPLEDFAIVAPKKSLREEASLHDMRNVQAAIVQPRNYTLFCLG